MGILTVEEAAFHQLYRDHDWPVLRYALHRTGDESTARDVTAETFLVVWRRWDQVPAGAALPWLYGIARRVLANERRRRDRAEHLVQRLGEEIIRAADPGDDRARLAVTLVALPL